jgi:hypothetical protein
VDARVIDRVLWEVAETHVDHWLHGLREHRELHLGDQYDRHDRDVNQKMDDLNSVNFYLRSCLLSPLQILNTNITV